MTYFIEISGADLSACHKNEHKKIDLNVFWAQTS